MALFGALAFAGRGGRPDLRISAKVVGTPTPTAQRREAQGTGGDAQAFSASGAWTMSSLPACFFEQDHRFGSLAALRPEFPPEAERIAAGTTLRSGDCRIAVGADELVITRGADRLRVPPDARLYRRGNRLTLVWIDGRHAEIRHYCRGFDAVRCPTQSFPQPFVKAID